MIDGLTTKRSEAGVVITISSADSANFWNVGCSYHKQNVKIEMCVRDFSHEAVE